MAAQCIYISTCYTVSSVVYLCYGVCSILHEPQCIVKERMFKNGNCRKEVISAKKWISVSGLCVGWFNCIYNKSIWKDPQKYCHWNMKSWRS